MYEATNHWNKKKNSPGKSGNMVKNPETGEVSTPRKKSWGIRMSMDAGAAHVLKSMAEESGLGKTLEEAFGKEDGGRIFSLAAFCATKNKPMYLFADRAETTDGMKKFSMGSQEAIKLKNARLNLLIYLSDWLN